MNWLFVTTRFPWPLTHGTYLRVYHLGRSLAGLGETVAVLGRRGAREAVEAYGRAGVTALPGPEGDAPSAGPARRRCSPYVFDTELADAVAEQAGRFDAVVLEGPAVLQYAEEAAAARWVVADLADDPVLEERRRLWRDPHPRALLRRALFLAKHRRYERVFLPPVGLATFVSEADRDSFARRHPRLPLTVIPNGADLERFARPADRPVETLGPSVLFTGNMGFPPNEDAAEHLVRDVAPRVWRRRPEVRFVLAGAEPSARVQALAGERVEVTGWVEDLRPYLWAAGVVALPMRIGTGIKNKLLEAWAASAAVVATPRACQGVPARDGENLLVAAGPGPFAEALLCVLDDAGLRARLAAGGIQAVRAHHAWPALAARLREAVCQGR